MTNNSFPWQGATRGSCVCFLRVNNNRLKLAEAVLSGERRLRTEKRNVSILRLPKENKCNMLAEQANITRSDACDSRSPCGIGASF